MSKYDEVLRPFVSLMERELHANSGKGDRPGWLAMSAYDCVLEIYYHAAKLQKAIKDGNGDGIAEYSADVANMAMMVADICGAIHLATPVVERPPVAIDRVDVQLLKGGLFRLAVEPDGTLVRYQDHCTQVEQLQLEIDRLNRVKLALAEKATAHADNCAVYRAQLASPPAPVAVACAHEWTDDGEFTLICTKCGKEENHEPYGWVQTRGDAINHFTQEWDVVQEWVDSGFEYKEVFEHDSSPASVVALPDRATDQNSSELMKSIGKYGAVAVWHGADIWNACLDKVKELNS